MTRSWQLQGAALQEGTPERQGRLTTEAMAGADWVLRSWTATEPAASEPAVTLVFEGGRFAGHAGCNRYTAGVEAGDQPGDIAVGPIAGTRMMCPSRSWPPRRGFFAVSAVQGSSPSSPGSWL